MKHAPYSEMVAQRGPRVCVCCHRITLRPHRHHLDYTDGQVVTHGKARPDGPAVWVCQRCHGQIHERHESWESSELVRATYEVWLAHHKPVPIPRTQRAPQLEEALPGFESRLLQRFGDGGMRIRHRAELFTIVIERTNVDGFVVQSAIARDSAGREVAGGYECSVNETLRQLEARRANKPAVV